MRNFINIQNYYEKLMVIIDQLAILRCREVVISAVCDITYILDTQNPSEDKSNRNFHGL